MTFLQYMQKINHCHPTPFYLAKSLYIITQRYPITNALLFHATMCENACFCGVQSFMKQYIPLINTVLMRNQINMDAPYRVWMFYNEHGEYATG